MMVSSGSTTASSMSVTVNGSEATQRPDSIWKSPGVKVNKGVNPT